MHPYKLIKDLNTNYKSSNFDKIINGKINYFILNYIKKFFLK